MIFQIKESREYRLNLYYIIAQGLYWMMVCCTISMGSAYLSNRGYSTVGIGALFAIAYLVATVLQQVVSYLTDKASSFDVVDVLALLGAIVTLDLFFAIGTNAKGFGTSFTFFIGAMVATVIQPFLNALNFHIEKYNVEMNFGVARASGSFFFFIMSLLAGNFMTLTTERAVTILGFVVSATFVVVIILIYRELKNSGIEIQDDYDPFSDESKDNNFSLELVKTFIDKYEMFFVFLIGVVCFYFGHVLINNFLYQITVNVGGNEASNGGLLALQAIVELPAMIFFNQLKDKFGSIKLLSVSAIFYLVKILVTTLATSVGLLYFSMLFQALAFAIFIPASVHFVDEIMNKQDAVKGQAFVTIAMTFSNLLSSLLGGVLIRIIGVTPTLWFGTIITFIGVVIAIFGLAKICENN